MRLFITISLIALALSVPLFAEVAVTVYNQDIGLVHETRDFDLSKGQHEIKFTDVAALIIPSSVHFSCPGVQLLEQNYEYDLVDAQKLLSKYIDQQVELYTENEGFFRGVLLASVGDVIIREADGSIRSISRDKIFNVHFPTLPEGLITRPTLVWSVEADKSARKTCEISYLTNGLSWEAEYVAVTNDDDTALDLSGWTNITNRSGTTYNNAKLKLVAGDVQTEMRGGGRNRNGRFMKTMAAPQFEEQAFYEYHLYTLQRRSTIRDNQEKQISLFTPANVRKVEKEYRLAWHKWQDKVRVFLKFKNSKDNNLAIPLPKGLIRVYKYDKDGGQVFLGEDRISHTPSNEDINVSTGFAFDLVGERKELDRDSRGRSREYEIEIKLRNRKDVSVEVMVEENIQGDWEMVQATPGWEKKSSSLIEWKIKIKPDEEKVINYRVLVN